MDVLREKHFPIRLNKDGSISKEVLDILNKIVFNAMRSKYLGEIKFFFDGNGSIVKAERREVIK